MCLNCIILIIQLIQLVAYPLKSSFQIQNLDNKFYDFLFYYIPISFFLFEICVHFNICYYEHGIKIQNKGQIFLKYSSNKFLFDTICIIIVQLNSYYNYFPIYLLFAIFSIKKILMNLKNINEHFQIEQRFSTTYDLVNLSLIVFYMGHYCACGYYFIGNLNISATNWISHYGFSNESWIVNYVNSIYFTFITMITVGFGDIAPVNMYEKVYVIFMTVVSCGVFAYAINTIGRIFSEMAQKEAKYKNKKFEISKLMQQRNITKKTQRKVLKFMEYEQNQEVESYQKGEEILLNISKSLRDEVNKEYFGKFLNDIKLFRLNFSKDFLMKLTSHIKEKTYGPNEIIFSQGDLDKNFYFICKGSIQLYMNNKVSQTRDDDFDLVSVGKGSLLGLNSFITGNAKDISAKSMNVCHLIFCSEEDFLETIKQHETDYEKYCMLRDSVNLYNDHYGLPCFSCNKFDHQASHCTLYNLRLDRELVNFRHIYCPQQQRDPGGRKSQRRKNMIQSLSQRQIYSISLKRLRLHYVKELYGFSDEEDNDEEDSVQQSSEYNVELAESNYDHDSQYSQKLTLDERIANYKTDKDYFMNVQQIRQKDIQQYFIYLGQADSYSPDIQILDYSNSISEGDSQFDDDDEEDEQEDKFNQSNSLSTQQKQSSQSSFQFFTNQKQDKSNQQHNAIQIQSQKDPHQNVSSQNKLGQEQNQKQNTNNSLSHELFGASSNIIPEIQRPSIYKQFSHLRGSIFSGNTNQESDFQISLNNLTQKLQSSQSSLQINEEEKIFGEFQENSLLRKKTKVTKQQSHDIKDYESDSVIMTGSLITKPHFQTNKKSIVQTAEQMKKRMTLTQTKRKSVSVKPDYESSKNLNTLGMSTIQDLSNQPISALKQKFSTKFLQQSNQVIDFPGKYFDIFDQFDKLKDFICYFPAFNASTVLKEQRKKAYQQLVMMRYYKLQIAPKPTNSVQDQEKHCALNASPKKLGSHQQYKHHPKK